MSRSRGCSSASRRRPRRDRLTPRRTRWRSAPRRAPRASASTPTCRPPTSEWILAAVAQARPEAARLIGEVDGLVQIGAYVVDGALGVTSGGTGGFTVGLDLRRLNNDRVMDRDTVVLHELGHVIDFALVPADVNAALDAQIPVGGPCGMRDRLRPPRGALRRHVRQVGAQRRRVGGRRRLRHRDAGVARGLGRAARGARLRAPGRLSHASGAAVSVATTTPSGAVIQRIGPSASTVASPAPAAARCSISAARPPLGSLATSSSSSASQ